MSPSRPGPGSLVMCLVVLIYVVVGGMRSTAAVNTFQTLVFIAVSGLAFFVITAGMGGFVPAMARLGEQSPELLELARTPRDWIQIATYLFVPLSTSCFPHIFSHWMSARSAEAFRLPVLAYPYASPRCGSPRWCSGRSAGSMFPWTRRGRSSSC